MTPDEAAALISLAGLTGEEAPRREAARLLGAPGERPWFVDDA